MFKMHMTCGDGPVVNPLQVIFYQPGRFAKIIAGNYIGDFIVMLNLGGNPTAQFENPAAQTYRRLRRIF